MKLKITVAIEHANGEPAVQPTTMDVEIPEFEAFTSPETFGAVFDTCERQAIKLRNEAMRVAIENYLNELVKKRCRAQEEKGNELKSREAIPSMLNWVVSP
jgi:hypothetical protein